MSPEFVPRAPRVIRVLGRSGSGKTTFIDALVRACTNWSVAVVKHSRTSMSPPQTGKDTALHFAAGAVASVGLSPGYAEAFLRDPAFGLDEVLAFFVGKVDLVIVEGAREADLPTILLGELPPGAVAGQILLSLPPRPEASEDLLASVRALLATLPTCP